MSELYGRPWETSCGHVGGAVYQTWARELMKLNARQLARGLGRVVQEASEFPPNLVKFLALCRAADPASHAPMLPAPEVRQTRSVAEAALAGLRDIAGLPTKPLSGWKEQRPELLEDKSA